MTLQELCSKLSHSSLTPGHLQSLFSWFVSSSLSRWTLRCRQNSARAAGLYCDTWQRGHSVLNDPCKGGQSGMWSHGHALAMWVKKRTIPVSGSSSLLLTTEVLIKCRFLPLQQAAAFDGCSQGTEKKERKKTLRFGKIQFPTLMHRLMLTVRFSYALCLLWKSGHQQGTGDLFIFSSLAGFANAAVPTASPRRCRLWGLCSPRSHIAAVALGTAGVPL